MSVHVRGEVPLDLAVWLSHSREVALVRSLAAALPAARFLLEVPDRARLRFQDKGVDVERPYRQGWAGLVSGRVESVEDADPTRQPAPFEPYVTDLPPPLMRLESCWFALDTDGRVGCFYRDQLGAAPMHRCWGPRPEPRVGPDDPARVVAAIAERHASASLGPAHALTFVADAESLVAAIARGAPAAAERTWVVAIDGSRVVLATGAGTAARPPVAATMLAWLHESGTCAGCARGSMRDPRLFGIYLFQHHERLVAAPYDRVAVPVAPWTRDEAASVLGLAPGALERSVLPVRFIEKARLQPIEYVPCTWSDTMPWESEAGTRHLGAPRP